LFLLACLCWFLPGCQWLSPPLTPETTYFKLLGGALNDVAYDIAFTGQGDFLIAGAEVNIITDEASQLPVEVSRAMLYRLTDAGTLVWQTEVPGKTAKAVRVQGQEAAYVATDYITTKINGQNITKVALSKVSLATGTVEWTKIYDENVSATFFPNDQIQQAIQLEIKGQEIIIAATYNVNCQSSASQLCQKALFIYTDLSGNVLLSKVQRYGLDNYDNTIARIRQQDNIIFWCGTTVVSGSTPRIRVAGFRQDNNTTPIFDILTLGDPLKNETGSDLQVGTDGNLYLIGSSNQDIFLARIDLQRDSQGNIIAWNKAWQKTIGGSGEDEGIALFIAANGDLLVAGDISSTSQNEEIYVGRYSAGGTLLWEQTFGGRGNDHARLIQELPSGEILLLGTLFFENNDMITLIRLTADGSFIE
jgi:hypothetical protein